MVSDIITPLRFQSEPVSRNLWSESVTDTITPTKLLLESPPVSVRTAPLSNRIKPPWFQAELKGVHLWTILVSDTVTILWTQAAYPGRIS
jgi:hypothetical protein